MQVHLIKNENGIEEWMMIELQGTIENGGGSLSDELIGNIGWRKDDSEALLLVGHHLLEGKLVQLEKPLLVAVPLPAEDSINSDRTLAVEAIIRRRIIFKNRPKPIVTKTLVKKSTLMAEEAEAENQAPTEA